jgi:hypothetical protein
LTTVPLRDAVRPATGWLDRFRGIDRRPALWRVTAAVTAAAFAAVLFLAAPGSVELVRNAPDSGAPASSLRGWTAPCRSNEYVPLGASQVAFCARTDGRVIGSFTNGVGETHVLVAGGFHLTLVELKRGMHTPSWGSRIVAVGPMATTDGLRELHAITLVAK